jgi:urea transport system substrate-binding protein
MLIPISGPAGLFGPSSRHCAELAADEINAGGGIAGRAVQLTFIDAGRAEADVVRDVRAAWQSAGVEAFIGMHDSAVRTALIRLFKGQVPYIYTPTYEGDDCSRGLYVLGETPSQLLGPVMPWLSASRRLRRWYLVGNDYIWPRHTNRVARQYIEAGGTALAGEEYLPFDTEDFDPVLKRVAESRADAVLITLVGAASIRFNRQFAARGLPRSVLRLGTLIEENTLAGIGADHSANLYASSGYFASLRTTAARDFAAQYAARFGANAPLLNVLAQSCYEGLRLLAVMGNNAGSVEVSRLEAVAQWQITTGPRGMTVLHARHAIRDIYLARAEGTSFEVIKTFEAVRSGQQCRL